MKIYIEPAGRQPRLNHKTFKREAGKTRSLKSDLGKKPRLASENNKRAHTCGSGDGSSGLSL